MRTAIDNLETIPDNPREWRPQRAKHARYSEVVDPILEPLWSGIRVLAHFEDSGSDDEWGRVVIIDEYGDDATIDAPQAAEQLRRAIRARSAVIDGILTREATAGGENISVGLFPTVNPLRKFFLGGTAESDVKYEPRGPRREGPPAFVAVDLLSVDGQQLFDVALLERKRILESLIEESELVRVSPWARPPVRTWFNTWRSAGFRGMMMKASNGRYRPGEDTADWALVERMPRA
jgi:hypothetical protein